VVVLTEHGNREAIGGKDGKEEKRGEKKRKEERTSRVLSRWRTRWRWYCLFGWVRLNE